MKAGLASDQIGLTLGTVACDALIAYYGSVKAAALTLGNVDPSLMQREIKAGDLRRFHKHADAGAIAALTQALGVAFGQLMTPKALAHQHLDRMQDAINLLRQYIEAA